MIPNHCKYLQTPTNTQHITGPCLEYLLHKYLIYKRSCYNPYKYQKPHQVQDTLEPEVIHFTALLREPDKIHYWEYPLHYTALL